MENTPVAPTSDAIAPEASVATPNQTSEAPAPEPITPEIGVEQVAKYLGTDVETFEKFNTFVKNNGQFDGAFKKMKDVISGPQQAPQQPQTVQTPSQQPEAPQPASPQATAPSAGTYSMEEIAALTYFDRLADMDQYKNIADDIRSGKVLEGLKSFNISPITDGRINDADVRRYLDLYAASKPPVPTSATPTADTQIEYLPIKEVKTMEEATKIQLQNIQLRAEGKPLHPSTQAANDFVKNYYKTTK